MTAVSTNVIYYTMFYQNVKAAFPQAPLNSIMGDCKKLLPLILLNSDNSSLIDEGIVRCKDNLSTRFSSLKLSPAHLAAIRGDHSTLNALHDAGAKMDLPDVLDFTPLQHLAMKGDVAGVSTLLKWGANPEHRNKMGGTYADLLRFNEPFREPLSPALNSTLFSAHKNDNLDVDSKCIPQGVKYVDENVLRQGQLIRMWGEMSKKKGIEKDAASQHLKDKDEESKYALFKASPPKLAIEPVTHDDAGLELGKEASFCGLFAKEPIKKGAFIAEYAGEMFFDERFLDGLYLWREWPSVDSEFFRSAASMSNHAFSNAEIKYANRDGKGLDGLPGRKILVATQDIAAGEQITLNYGQEYSWKQPPIELRPDAVKKYIRANSWQDLFDNFNSVLGPGKFLKAGLETQNKVVRLFEILTSPSNLLTLVDDKLITPKDFKLIKSNVQAVPTLLRLMSPTLLETVEKKLAEDKQEL